MDLNYKSQSSLRASGLLCALFEFSLPLSLSTSLSLSLSLSSFLSQFITQIDTQNGFAGKKNAV